MKKKGNDLFEVLFTDSLYTGLLISYGWVIESNEAIAFGKPRGPYTPPSTLVSDPILVHGFAAFVLLGPASMATLTAKRVGLNAFASLAIGVVVLLLPILCFVLR